MKFILLFIMVHLYETSPAQLRSSLPVEYTAVVTYSRNFADLFCSTANQAALAQLRQPVAGVYSEKRLMLKEIRTFVGAVALPVLKTGAVGIVANYLRFGDFTKAQAGLAYGRSLGTMADLGIQLNYHHVSINGYGGASAITIELGTIFHLTDKLTAGCHVLNPAVGKFGDHKAEKISSVYSLGLGYEASEKLFLGANILKEENQKTNIVVGLHYAFEQQFFVRTGIGSTLGNCFAGAGIRWKDMRLDFAVDWQPGIGLTPSVLLLWTLNKAKTAIE